MLAAVVLAGGAAGAAVALSGRRTPAPAPPPKPKPVHFAVGLARCTFVDAARSTTDYATGTTTPGRRLVTEIRYPTLSPRAGAAETAGAHPAYRHGPYPTVVFAHGYGVDPATYAALLDAWARAGTVVVAPVFPDTSVAGLTAQHDDPAAESDVTANQPADVAYVTHRVLAASATGVGCPVLHGLLAPGRVSLAGQSDGGETVAMLAYDHAPAVRALLGGLAYRGVAVLSGQEDPAEPDEYAASAADPPLLVVQSLTDTCNPPQSSVALYQAVQQPDRWFLALASARHLPPYDGTDRAAFADVARVTTAFFRQVAAGRSVGPSLAGAAAASPAVGSLYAGADLPASVQNLSLPQSLATCFER